MMRIEVSGIEQHCDGSSEQIRAFLRALDPSSDAILRVTDGRDNLDVVHLADGFYVTGNDPNDRHRAFTSPAALSEDAAVEAVVAYYVSAQLPSPDHALQAPAKRGKTSGSRSKTPLVGLFFASVIMCGGGLALLASDPVGQVSTPTYVVGIGSLVLWALFSFAMLSRGLELIRAWLARRLNVRIEIDVAVQNSSWRVLEKGRWWAKFIVAVVPLLVVLLLLLGALVGGSLFFIVG